MKTKRKVVFAILLVLVLTLTSGTAIANNKTPYSGTECWVADLAPGEWVLKDGKMHVSGYVQQFTDAVSDPRISGDTYVTVNAILDPATFSGPMWGKAEIVNADGAWTGQYVGSLDNYVSSVHANMHGSGAYKGLIANVEYNRPGPWACFVVEGYIVETGH